MKIKLLFVFAALFSSFAFSQAELPTNVGVQRGGDISGGVNTAITTANKTSVIGSGNTSLEGSYGNTNIQGSYGNTNIQGSYGNTSVANSGNTDIKGSGNTAIASGNGNTTTVIVVAPEK